MEALETFLRENKTILDQLKQEMIARHPGIDKIQFPDSLDVPPLHQDLWKYVKEHNRTPLDLGIAGPLLAFQGGPRLLKA